MCACSRRRRGPQQLVSPQSAHTAGRCIMPRAPEEGAEARGGQVRQHADGGGRVHVVLLDVEEKNGGALEDRADRVLVVVVVDVLRGGVTRRGWA